MNERNKLSKLQQINEIICNNIIYNIKITNLIELTKNNTNTENKFLF